MTASVGKFLRKQWFKRLPGNGGDGELNQAFVAKDKIGRTIRSGGFGFTPAPEFAQNGEAGGAEIAAAFEAPDLIRIGRMQFSAVGDEARAGFFLPTEAALGFQFGFEAVGQWLEIMGVVAGVSFHALGQWALGPIGFLRTFVERDAEVLGNEVGQAELRDAEQPRGEHGVEDAGRDELVVLAKESQVVVRSVHDEPVRAKLFEKRRETNAGERVNEFIAIERGDLDETNLFGIGVKTVRFGIERDPRRGTQAG